MSAVATRQRSPRELRLSLFNPPNAVVDRPIFLVRGQPPVIPPHKEEEIRRAHEIALAKARQPLCVDESGALWVEPKKQVPVSIEMIQRAVARHFGITRRELLGRKLTYEFVRPRQVAMYLSKVILNKSLPDVGRRFAKRDHTTVLCAIRRILKLVETDPEMRESVLSIGRSLDPTFEIVQAPTHDNNLSSIKRVLIDAVAVRATL